MQITIAKLWPASPKYVSFKGVDGRSYKGEPNLNGKLFEGMTIEATCKESHYTNQKGEPATTWWLPKNFTPDNGTVGAIIPQVAPNGVQSGHSNPTQYQYGAPPPRPAGNSDKTAMQIFVTGIVGRAMGSGKFGIDDIPELTRKAREAWDLHG